MKPVINDIVSNTAVWVGAIAAWQVDFEYWVKIIAGIGAIALSAVSIYYKVINNGKD